MANMKLLHLSDLHIGKRLNDFNLLDEQRFVLNQAVSLVENKKIEGVLLAGDIFDKSIPSTSALEIFDEFLFNLNKLDSKIFIIAGNHDNLERLSYHSSILEKSNIFISKNFEGSIQRISLNDKIDVYLMPYLYPALVRRYFPGVQINSYNDAIKAVIDNTKIDEYKINIILSHQFVTGKNQESILSSSEQRNVGGIDEVSSEIYEKFDYAALGHLHCAQKTGCDKIRYAGSILKYSLSEINQKKEFLVIDFISKDNISYKTYPIKFLHELKQYKGFIDEFLDEKFYSKINRNDYIYFVLYDEAVFDAKKKLSLIYPNIMMLEFENKYTKNRPSVLKIAQSKKNILEHFMDFYKFQIGETPSFEEEKIINELINEISAEEKCVL